MKPTQIVFTVINDLTYDRRMRRICRTLADAGYEVLLVGRRFNKSIPFEEKRFKGVRLRCWVNSGPLFYAEYNIRLFFWLLTHHFDIACACDLDTALAVRCCAWLRRKRTVYDAHEYFSEVPELVHRPGIKRIWEWIAKISIPGFNLRYTVGEQLARVMGEKYKVRFHVIRNIEPHVQVEKTSIDIQDRPRILLYQGAINIGRGLEVIVEAMHQLTDWQCWLAGEGDITEQLKAHIQELGLQDRVKVLGWVHPDELPALMRKARLGINLRDQASINDYYSLANKFFDFIHMGLPSIHMNYPEYKTIVDQYACAFLIDHLHTEEIIAVIRRTDQQPQLLTEMVKACERAAQSLTWENEANLLIGLYQELLPMHR